MKGKLIKLPLWLNTKGCEVGAIYNIRNICINRQGIELAYVEMPKVERDGGKGAILPENNPGIKEITYTKPFPDQPIPGKDGIPGFYYVNMNCMMLFDSLIEDNEGGLVYLNQIDEQLC